MKPLVSVLTPSIPGRAGMLEQCLRSVRAQTFEYWTHLVEVDYRRDGCSKVMNRLARQADSPWLLPLADDDLLLPGALDLLYDHTDQADIVWAPPLVWGIQNPWWLFQEPPVIPSFALVRTELWMELGGYDESVIREEDRGLWTKAVAAGARFVKVVSEPTWVYRFHGGNKSLNAGIAA